MNSFDRQTDYWNGAASAKTFTHPIPLSLFRDELPRSARILDYGCGYGRTCSELMRAGYANVVGIDIAEAMVKRGRLQDGRLDLRVFDGRSTGFDDGSFDACLLLAVLTCIPSDDGIARTLTEVRRVLKPGGLLFVSDYPLQSDARNQARYREFESEFGTFGVFRTENAIVRHYGQEQISAWLSGFEEVWRDRIRVCTMNGNESDVFQIAARKKADLGPKD